MNIVDKRNFIETFCRRHTKRMRDDKIANPCERCIMHDVHENSRCWPYCSDLIVERNFDVLLSRLESNENEMLEIMAEMEKQKESD